MKYHGSQEERAEVQEILREIHPKHRIKGRPPQQPVDVIVAPVGYFQKESSSDRRFLNGFNYDYMIVDEAHSLKNAKSTRFKMLDRVKSEHRLLLTG